MDIHTPAVRDELKERMDELPENIYAVLFSKDTQKNAESLTALLSVPATEKTQVENYLTFTLLAYLPIDLLPAKLVEKTSLTLDQAEHVRTQFLNSLPIDVQSDLKEISEELLKEYPQSPEVESANKKNSLSHLQENFRALRESTETASSTKEERTHTPTSSDAPVGPPVLAEEIQAVQPMRTMASDVSRIHGYGAYRDEFPDEVGASAHKEEVIKAASQNNILNQRPVLTDNPSYTEDEAN